MAEFTAPLSVPEKEARRTVLTVEPDVNGAIRHPRDETWIGARHHIAIRHFHAVSDPEIMLR